MTVPRKRFRAALGVLAVAAVSPVLLAFDEGPASQPPMSATAEIAPRQASTLRSFMTIHQFTALNGARIEWARSEPKPVLAVETQWAASDRKPVIAASDGIAAPVPEAAPASSRTARPLPPYKPAAIPVESRQPIEYRQDAWEQTARRVASALTQALRARHQALASQKPPAQRAGAPLRAATAEPTFAPATALPGRQNLGVGARVPPPAVKPALPQRQPPMIRQGLQP